VLSGEAKAKCEKAYLNRMRSGGARAVDRIFVDPDIWEYLAIVADHRCPARCVNQASVDTDGQELDPMSNCHFKVQKNPAGANARDLILLVAHSTIERDEEVIVESYGEGYGLEQVRVAPGTTKEERAIARAKRAAARDSSEKVKATKAKRNTPKSKKRRARRNRGAARRSKNPFQHVFRALHRTPYSLHSSSSSPKLPGSGASRALFRRTHPPHPHSTD
jgi:hypothetical protein